MDLLSEVLNYLLKNAGNITIDVIAIMLMFIIVLLMRTFRQSEKENAINDIRYMDERKSYVSMIKDQMTYQDANIKALQEVATSMKLMNSQIAVIPKETSDMISVMVKEETSNIISYIQSVFDKGLPIRLGVLIVRPSGNVSFINTEAVQLLGVLKENVQNVNVFDIMQGAVDTNRKVFKREDLPVSKAIFSKETVFNKIVGYLHPIKKTLVWLALNIVPNVQEDGNVASAVCIFFDVGDFIPVSETMPLTQE